MIVRDLLPSKGQHGKELEGALLARGTMQTGLMDLYMGYI